jgi:hypothetical protein
MLSAAYQSMVDLMAFFFFHQEMSMQIYERYSVGTLYSLCGSTYVCKQLVFLVKRNNIPKRSELRDMHLLSVMKVVSSQKLKPNICKLSAGEIFRKPI